MNKEELAYFEKKLKDMMSELLSEAEKTLNDMTGTNTNYPDPTDRAAVESDRNFELRIRDRERRLLGKIQEALGRIEDGSYGICEECGEDISAQRMEARPVTTLCIDCKTRQEQHEKAQGR
ncbi:MAG: RNA polymerase-binding protein DksA [Thermodesulfobacteriota bacterium]